MNHLPNANDITMVADKHNNLAVVYDSVQAIARFANARYKDPDGLIRQWSGRMPDGKPLALSVNKDEHDSGITAPQSRDWDKNTGLAGAIDLAKKGWVEGVKDLKKDSLSALQHTEEAHRNSFSNDVTGAFPVIGAFLSGRPDCMKRYHKHSTDSPIISLLIPSGCAADTNARDLIRRGRAVLRLINNLEAEGFQVGLYMGEQHLANGNARDLFWHFISLKHPERDLPLTDTAFALAHPAADRRLLITSLEIFRHGLKPGYGIAKNIQLDSDHAIRNHLPNAVTLPHYYRSRDFARRTEDDFYKEALAAVEHYVKKSG